MGFFSDSQYGFRSSRATAELLAVVSDNIARTFNSSGTLAVALDMSKDLFLKKNNFLRCCGWLFFLNLID